VAAGGSGNATVYRLQSIHWLPVWLPCGGQPSRHLSGSQFYLVKPDPLAHSQVIYQIE
jgi:hypothetical protein